MMNFNFFPKTSAAALLSILIALPSAANAEESEKEDAITVSGSVGVFSEFRFRGAAVSNKTAVVQASVTVATKSGFYATVWGSPNDFAGGTEIDLVAGYTKNLGGVTLDGGAIYYVYPNDKHLGFGNLDSFELYGSVSTNIGPVTPKVGVNWAPAQSTVLNGCTDCSGGRDNFYVYGSLAVAIPGTPVTINGQLGHENGAFDYNVNGGKLDWSVGASATIEGFTLSAAYVGSDVDPFLNSHGKNITDDAVVISLAKSF